MTTAQQFLFGFLLVILASVSLYVIFAPWLAQIDISKNTKSIADELRKLNGTLQELKEKIEGKEK